MKWGKVYERESMFVKTVLTLPFLLVLQEAMKEREKEKQRQQEWETKHKLKT